MIDAQDKMLQDAFATLKGEGATAPIAETPRRTRIVEQVLTPTMPTTGYRVTVAGIDIDVEASDHGDAVVRALMLDTTPSEAGRYVFMWNYSVADSTGIVLDGGDRLMRESLQAARIRHETERFAR